MQICDTCVKISCVTHIFNTGLWNVREFRGCTNLSHIYGKCIFYENLTKYVNVSSVIQICDTCVKISCVTHIFNTGLWNVREFRGCTNLSHIYGKCIFYENLTKYVNVSGVMQICDTCVKISYVTHIFNTGLWNVREFRGCTNLSHIYGKCIFYENLTKYVNVSSVMQICDTCVKISCVTHIFNTGLWNVREFRGCTNLSHIYGKCIFYENLTKYVNVSSVIQICDTCVKISCVTHIFNTGLWNVREFRGCTNLSHIYGKCIFYENLTKYVNVSGVMQICDTCVKISYVTHIFNTGLWNVREFRGCTNLSHIYGKCIFYENQIKYVNVSSVMQICDTCVKISCATHIFNTGLWNVQVSCKHLTCLDNILKWNIWFCWYMVLNRGWLR